MNFLYNSCVTKIMVWLETDNPYPHPVKFYISHSWTLLGTNISKLVKFSVRSALDLRVKNETRKKKSLLDLQF